MIMFDFVHKGQLWRSVALGLDTACNQCGFSASDCELVKQRNVPHITESDLQRLNAFFIKLVDK